MNTNSLPSYGCLKLIPCGELGGNDDGVIAGGLFAPEQVHAREFAEHDGGVWRLELRSLRRLHYFTLSTIVRCFAEWGAAAVLAFLPLLALFSTWQPLGWITVYQIRLSMCGGVAVAIPTQAIVVAVVTRSSCCLGLRRPFGVRRGSRRRHIVHRNKLANVTITKAHLNTLLCYVCVSFFLCRTPPLPFTPAPMSVVPWVSTLPSVPSLSLSLRVSLRSAPRTMDHATFTTSENQKTCVQGVHGNCRECSAGY